MNETKHNSASVELLLDEICKLQNQIAAINTELEVSTLSAVSTRDTTFAGITTSILSQGEKYNLWGSGSTTSGGSLANGQTYYIMTGSDFAPLSYYQGSSSITTMWLHSGSNDYSFPLRFDTTGIYFTCPTGGVSFTAGATLGFTQTLILAPTT